MNLPDKNETYKLKEYWDERFTTEDNFEWCKNYSNFQHLINNHVEKTDRILVLGCGNSTLSEDMYRDGYRNIVNIDFSEIVIEKMRRKYQDLVSMQWLVMDITKMSFAPSSFDVVLEKATIDTLLVEEKDLWNPSEESQSLMHSVLSQVSKILKMGGCFISVTFSQPHFRKVFLAKSQYDWSITTHTFGEHFHFFFYVMEKGKQLSDIDKTIETTVENKDKVGSKGVVYTLDDDSENDLFNIQI